MSIRFKDKKDYKEIKKCYYSLKYIDSLDITGQYILPVSMVDFLGISNVHKFMSELKKKGYVMPEENKMVLSSVGKAFLDKYSIIEFISRYDYLGIDGFHLIRNSKLQTRNEFLKEIIIKASEIVNSEKVTDEIETRSYIYIIAESYYELTRYDKALFYYLLTMYYDLSGICYSTDIERLKAGKILKSTFNSNIYTIKIDYELKKKIFELSNYYNEVLVDKVFKTLEFKDSLITSDDFKSIIALIIKNDEINIDNALYKLIKIN